MDRKTSSLTLKWPFLRYCLQMYSNEYVTGFIKPFPSRIKEHLQVPVLFSLAAWRAVRAAVVQIVISLKISDQLLKLCLQSGVYTKRHTWSHLSSSPTISSPSCVWFAPRGRVISHLVCAVVTVSTLILSEGPGRWRAGAGRVRS